MTFPVDFLRYGDVSWALVLKTGVRTLLLLLPTTHA